MICGNLTNITVTSYPLSSAAFRHVAVSLREPGSVARHFHVNFAGQTRTHLGYRVSASMGCLSASDPGQWCLDGSLQMTDGMKRVWTRCSWQAPNTAVILTSRLQGHSIEQITKGLLSVTAFRPMQVEVFILSLAVKLFSSQVLLGSPLCDTCS